MDRVEGWLIKMGASMALKGVAARCWEHRVVGMGLLHLGCTLMRVRLWRW